MTKFVKGKEKFSYGFAAVASYMVANMASSYLNIYLTDILLVPTTFILVLMICSRVWDMLNDPMMGVIVDKTNTPQGKMRPYVRVGAYIMAAFTVFLFYPLSGTSDAWKMVFATFMYLGFGMAYTLVDVPAMGMMSVATPDKDERASLLSFYVTVGSVGGLLPAALYFVLDYFVPQRWIYFVISAFVGVLVLCGYLCLYYNSKERFATSTERIKVKEMFKVVAKNKPMVLTLLMSMLASPRYLIMLCAIYISIYVVKIPGMEPGTVQLLLYLIVGAGMFAGFAGILLTPVFYKRIGYKRTSLIAGAIGAVFLGAGFFVGLANIYAALPFMMIGGLGLGAYNTLPYPMVGDSLDYLEWKTGNRMEGICFSFNSFVTKFNNAVGAAGLALGLIVFQYVQPVVPGEYLPQSEFTVNGLYSMVTLVPAIGFLLSLIPMALYGYTGAKKERILAELAERRKAAEENADATSEGNVAEPATVAACKTDGHVAAPSSTPSVAAENVSE